MTRECARFARSIKWLWRIIAVSFQALISKFSKIWCVYYSRRRSNCSPLISTILSVSWGKIETTTHFISHVQVCGTHDIIAPPQYTEDPQSLELDLKEAQVISPPPSPIAYVKLEEAFKPILWIAWFSMQGGEGNYLFSFRPLYVELFSVPHGIIMHCSSF